MQNSVVSQHRFMNATTDNRSFYNKAQFSADRLVFTGCTETGRRAPSSDECRSRRCDAPLLATSLRGQSARHGNSSDIGSTACHKSQTAVPMRHNLFIAPIAVETPTP